MIKNSFLFSEQGKPIPAHCESNRKMTSVGKQRLTPLSLKFALMKGVKELEHGVGFKVGNNDV